MWVFTHSNFFQVDVGSDVAHMVFVDVDQQHRSDIYDGPHHYCSGHTDDGAGEQPKLSYVWRQK